MDSSGRPVQERWAGYLEGAVRIGRAPYFLICAFDAILVFVLLWCGLTGSAIVAAVGAVGALILVGQLAAARDTRRIITAVQRPDPYQRHLALHGGQDELTDLATGSLFAEQLDVALSRPGRGAMSLALVDLDDFALVNEEHGREMGDELLISVAERLRTGIRPLDLVARLGGDEFAVLLEGINPQYVDTVAERILDILVEPMSFGDQTLTVSASVGIAEANPIDNAIRLISRADVAMQQAKGAGKGRYARYAAVMAPRRSTRAQTIVDFQAALTGGQFELYYQPVVTLPDGRLKGVEALLRWRHPERGLRPPLDFIPAAEQTGMIVPIGRWVLRAACRQAAEWLAEYPATAPRTISVNVSPRQLAEPSIVDYVLSALSDSGLPAEHLIVEVTETAVLNTTDAGDSLRAIRKLGVRVALDDFGTGHSTLSLLDAFPVDQLKLERSLIGVPGHDVVAAAVVSIARAIGVEAVAEGIEDAAQAERLSRLGYPLAQGFHFGRPATAGDITASLRPDRVSA